MDRKQVRLIKTWFREYLNGFTPQTDAARQMFTMKIIHSNHVAANCRQIAQELDWSGEDIQNAEILGQLHDVGRFPQIMEYCTFIDSESVDHGEKGYEVVGENGLLTQFSGEVRKCIMTGIRLHNSRYIPDGIKGRELAYLKLIRDADKLDIFRVVEESLKNGELHRRLRKISNVKNEGSVNPRVLAEINARRTVSYENVISQADFYMLRLSWVYDFNFEPALRRLYDWGILETLIGLLPEDREIRASAEKILEHSIQG